jgi:hypothetical protein
VVALVWWVALFESVTQKGIRAAAAPMNTFAVYYDRDDLNVCKRARENGDRTKWKPEASDEIPLMQERRYAQRNSVAPMSPLVSINGRRLHGGL